MEHDTRSDTELMELAKAGWAPAFAVLLYRHGPAVRAAVATDDDPTGAVTGTYVAAMRGLKHQPPGEPVSPWLLELAATQVSDVTPVAPGTAPPFDDDGELDEIWAELDIRWPNGRVSRRPPAWLGWVALVIALVALGVLVPYVVLSADADEDDEPLDQLRAVPLEVEEPEREAAPELFEDEALGELPVFEFPEVEEELPPPPTTETTSPPPPPTPIPEPLLPDPEPTTPEDDTGDGDDSGDGGGGDDGSTGDDDGSDDGSDDDGGDDGSDDDGDDDGGSTDDEGLTGSERRTAATIAA